MKHPTPLFISGLFSLALAVGGCTQQSSDGMSTAGEGMSMDPTVVAPEVYTLLHEDERVRILDMKLPAGVTDGMHSHRDEAVYFIQGSKVRVHMPDGSSTEMDIPDRTPFSHEAWTHAVENVGDSLLHAVVVEIQEGARDSSGVVPEGMAADDTSPGVYSLLHEDDRVRILEMRLPAGQSDNEHVHSAEAVYFLSGGTVKVHLPNGEVVDVELPDGGTLSNPMWQHRVENVGETEVHAVIVELKEA